MSSKKTNRNRLWAATMILVVVLSILAGSAIGKYIKTEKFTGKLQFNADLAADFKLQESNAVRQNDGSYTLDTSTIVSANSYTLLPGLDIPKDPHVVITDKTAIETFLYVEVVDKTTGDAIIWKMSDQWLLLEGVQGKQDKGAVYVYAADGLTPTPLTKQPGDNVIYLLKDNTIEVSQTLLGANNSGDLVFYAAMGEVSAVTTGTAMARAKAIYVGHVAN